MNKEYQWTLEELEQQIQNFYDWQEQTDDQEEIDYYQSAIDDLIIKCERLEKEQAERKRKRKKSDNDPIII